MLKKIIIATFFIFISFNTKAQNRGEIELIDLIKLFAPDSGIDYYPYDWKKGAEVKSKVEWLTNGVELSENYIWYRTGNVNVSINGRTLECLGKYVEPCKWFIILKGEKYGYTNYHISSVTHQELDFVGMEQVFIDQSIKFKIIKKCEMSASDGFKIYSVIIPSKKEIWLKQSLSCGNSGCSITIDCYTSKELIDFNCN